MKSITMSRGPWRLALFALVTVGVIAAGMTGVATAALAASAHDYLKTNGLSAPKYNYATEVVRDTLTLPMKHDGEGIYLEITRPKDGRRHPVIFEASPYHGTLADREGTRILPEPRDANAQSLGLTRYFAPRGYAVVMMDLRGTGKSDGCLDHLGPKDRQDLMEVIKWIAVQGWSNGRVGMTGHSYVGSTPSLAAAAMAEATPNPLVTIVPSAGLATMYDHQFQGGVPYFLQWAGPMEAYEEIALTADLPGGENFGKNPDEVGCGLPNSSLVAGEDQLSGKYAPWHAEREWRAEARDATIPVFMVHGVNDNAARVTGMDWFTDRGGRAGDKLWLGQWDHGSGCCPTRRGLQWTYALHAWFDKHLAQRNVDTGPPVELFLSDGTFEEARAGDREQQLVTSAWPVPSTTKVNFYPAAGRPLAILSPTAPPSLSKTQPANAGKASFTGDPSGFNDPQATGGVEFATEQMSVDTMLAGEPELDLVASVTAPRVHLIANLYDEVTDADGNIIRRRISQFAINPELRNGLGTVTQVKPGFPMKLRPPAMAMAHNLRAGHKLVLRVTASDPDKVPTFAVDPQITVYTGPTLLETGTVASTVLRVPQVTSPTLVADTVPLEVLPKRPGNAQATIEAYVTPPVPGAGTRIAGVTSEHIEFTVEKGKDNNRLVVGAVPSLPADIDLYLEKKQPDNTSWAAVIAGTSAELTHEGFVLAQPPPGEYRLEVHNWAGAPATRVDVTMTFLNSAGEDSTGEPWPGG